MAVTIDGTNGITSPDFEPSSSTTPTNGLFLPTTNALGFATNSTERLRLDASGNLGLGVTPSAWRSGEKAVDVGAYASISSFSNYVNFGNNYYTNSSNQNIYKNTAAASVYYQAGGQHIWLTAPSGTAGAAISFTQAMTLDASGNLGIGTTSVATGARADIRGLNANNLSDLDAQVLTVFDTTSYAQNVGGGIAFGYKYNSSGSNIQRAAVIKTVKENATDGNYASALVFATAPNGGSTVERARIDSSGNLLVGTTSAPTSRVGLVVRNSTSTSSVGNFYNDSATPYGCVVNFGSASPNNNTNWFFYAADSTAGRFFVYSNGGIANYSANNTNLSDARLKTAITPAPSWLAKINAIEVVNFKYKDQTHDDPNLGVIAQQVLSVAPELVDEEGFGETPEDGVPLMAIFETDLKYAMLKAIQELTTRLEALENK